MTREELKQILPHREPMLLLDRARRISECEAEGFYTVRGDEWFLSGHFPGNPIVPGVILCEMMAQTCCVLVAGEYSRQKAGTTPYFTGLDGVRFKKPVRAGDTLRFSCRLVRSKGAFYFAEGQGFADGAVCVQAKFSFALAGGRSDQT